MEDPVPDRNSITSTPPAGDACGEPKHVEAYPAPDERDTPVPPAKDLARLRDAVAAVPKPSGIPRRVLLSEDSSVNRNVGVQILRNLGYQVDAVSNGREALAAVQSCIYDLIVLDCETPEMDGYEAARAIRRLPDADRRRVPVIGLTAGSTLASREKRQAAGMNDYIVKPLRPQTVASVLARWDAAAHSIVAPPLAVDRDVLTSLAEIAGSSHPTLFNEIIELFLGSTPVRIAELRQALKKKSVKVLGEVAHNLRGSSGQLGAAGIEQTCASIETLAHAGSLKGVRELLDQLDLDFERVQNDLGTFAEERRANSLRPEGSVVPPARHGSILHAALQGKRLLVFHSNPRVVSDLEAVFQGTGCSVQKVGLEDTSFCGDVLFWGAGLDELVRRRDQGLRLPVIVVLQHPDQALLDRIQQLGVDFALEPFNSVDLQLRTILRLTIPLPTGMERLAPASSAPQELLVAEDDHLIARFLLSNLEGAGFHTTLVEDGDAALEALDRKPFAVVILDINMPKTDGFGVLSRLRLKSQRTPVLMLSARVHEHDIVKAFDLGADDYVTKPFNPLELITRIRRLARRQ